MEAILAAVKGVNLGGWLVLERWITPSLFASCDAMDEYSLSEHLGKKAAVVLKNHRDNFITEPDFLWLAKHKVEAVRLPVGFWAFGGEEPYIGCEDHIDFTFRQCQKYGLRLIIDIHGLPGSQNGYYHSGRGGHIGWSAGDIDKSLEFLEMLATKYRSQSSLVGIELANEPSSKLSRQVLMDYYLASYKIIRQTLSDEVAVIISDAFNAKRWMRSMPQSKYLNVWLDMHLYQVFSRADRRLDMKGHLKKALAWHTEITKAQKHMPVIVGEWSVALPPATKDIVNFDDAFRQYGQAQIEAFNKAVGWFYWTYKTENIKGWNFKRLVEEGILEL